MRNYFPKRPSDAPLHTLSKLYDVLVGFIAPPPPSFEAVHCFICGRRMVAVARYRMIGLVIIYFRIEKSDDELDLPLSSIGFKKSYNIDSLLVHPSVPPSFHPFFSQNCSHILSKVFRSTGKQLNQEVGSIRCGFTRTQRSY